MTRMLSFSWPVAGAGDSALAFPNGAKFNSTDVFLGGCMLHEIVITQAVTVGSASDAEVLVRLYDALTVSTGRILIGGTTNTESFRVIAGGTIVETDDKQPYVLAATPNAQLTGCTKRYDQQFAILDPTNQLRIPLHGLQFPAGCAALLTISQRINCSVSIEFTPLSSGWARRRRAYYPGSTTKHVDTDGDVATPFPAIL